MEKLYSDLYLVNGNITIFCGRQTEQFQNDALNSTLYAHLFATLRDTDRDTSWQTYSNIIGNLEWTVNSRTSQHLEFKATSLLSLVKLCAKNILTNSELVAIKDAFLRIGKLNKDSLAVTTLLGKLKKNAVNVTGGNYVLLNIVKENKSLLTLQLSFKSAEVLDIDIDILNEPLLASIDEARTNVRVLRSSLDESRYKSLRETIIKKLGGKIQTELLPVPTQPVIGC